MMQMDEWIRRLPKVELHMHIEGSLEPELLFELAERNEMPLAYDSVEALSQAYDFSDLQSFLDIYYQGAAVLRQSEDFYDLALRWYKRAARDNVRYAEIFFDPQTHTERGVPLATVIDGFRRAQIDAEEWLGIRSRYILCFLRHLSEEEALATLDEAMSFRDFIVGVGLDSSEVGHPPEKFQRVFARAAAAGLMRVAHAGEEGPPEYIRQALDLLDVQRIDHGVRCVEDMDLVTTLAERRIPLTVCPLSNLKLKVVDRMEDHPLRKMLEMGLCATVNSDDPAYFGGYMTDNYLAVQQALGLERAHIVMLARNGIEAAFVDDDERAMLSSELDEFLAA